MLKFIAGFFLTLFLWTLMSWALSLINAVITIPTWGFLPLALFALSGYISYKALD